jgi:hypothetical protein
MLHTISGSILTILAMGQPDTSFSDAERQRIVRYWNSPGRYEVSVAAEKTPWQVRLTPEGSQWLWNYNKARGLGKGPPGSTPTPVGPDEAVWEKWIEARVAYDRWLAGNEAAEKNGQTAPAAVHDPGDAPEGLVKLAGEPPKFANAVQPRQHKIKFDDDTVITFVDNPNMRHRYAYYRFCEGVMSAGTAVKSMPQGTLDKLFDKAGVSESAQKVMKSVSLLEGGFDSVNTYDTGFVSVGFIQFACLKDGAGSLGSVLQAQKRHYPVAYDRDFRKFGLDVNDKGCLVAVDPVSGEQSVGAAAAQTIIKDKRLIAVFQKAGRESEAFKISQIKVAYEQYYPENDLVTVLVGYSPLTGRVGDIIKSESGMATLMDRKVNTGKVEPLVSVLAEIATANNIATFSDFATYERDIVAALKYRKDYLTFGDLTQPGPQVHPNRSYLPSRHKSRDGGGRKKPGKKGI